MSDIQSFANDSVKYYAPSWIEMQNLCFQISKKIIENNEKFDRIITLAKGGWPMTLSLDDYLAIPHVASIGVSFYKGIQERYETPEIYQDLPISVRGERVLLFDDVADTGESLDFVTAHLQSLGVKSVTTATVYYKPHSVHLPKYYGAEVDAWIVFPYDHRKMTELLGKKWFEQGVSRDEIVTRLMQLGFPVEVVEEFLGI